MLERMTLGACESAHCVTVIGDRCRCCHSGNTEGAPISTLNNRVSELTARGLNDGSPFSNCGLIGARDMLVDSLLLANRGSPSGEFTHSSAKITVIGRRTLDRRTSIVQCTRSLLVTHSRAGFGEQRLDSAQSGMRVVVADA